MNEEVDKFIQKYRACIQRGQRRYTVPKRLSIEPVDLSEPFDLNFEYEYGVQIDMSKHDFETLIEMEAYFEKQLRDRDWENFGGYAKSIVDQYEREVRIRNANPAAKLAYEKYQLLMSMIDPEYKK
jgi:hypothetical protein